MATINGGNGSDNIFGTSSDDFLTGDNGTDAIDGGSGNDTIDGGNGKDTLAGGLGNDAIDGGNGEDSLSGGDGDDSLLGGNGKDKLSGGLGDDIIVAGNGADILTGGSGRDVFAYNASSESNAAEMDIISDFARREDKIDLRPLLGLTEDLAWGFQTPTAKGVWFAHSGGDTYVYADVDGKSANAELAIKLTGLHNLSNADFLGVKNIAPAVTADTDAVVEDHQPNPVNGNVLANDSDADAGTELTVDNAGTHAGIYGTLTLDADGSYSYVLNNAQASVQALAKDQVVHDVFSYTVSDGIVMTTATLDIKVTGTNDGPVATADSAAGTENQTLTIDVLTNDTDADDGHQFTLIEVNAPAGKGSASVVNNQLVFTPGSDFDHLAQGASEQVALSYTMQDEFGATSSSTVTVALTGANDAPRAAVDSAAGTENQTLAIDVLANDTDIDDGHQFTLVSANAPAEKGTASVVNNQLVFIPGSDFDHLAQGASEQVTLIYGMQDEFGAISSSTVSVTVTGTNDAPVAVADSAATAENKILTIDVLANDTDVDDGAYAFTLLAAGTPVGKGSVSVVNNQLAFNPGSDFDHLAQGASEQVMLTYSMEDELGATSSSTVAVTITGTNDAPIAAVDTAAGTENQTLTIDVLANDTDADDGHLFALLEVNTPANKGSTSVLNNQLVFTPGSDFDHLAQGASEQVTLTYTMKDEFGATSSSAVTVTITGTNDAPIAMADSAAGTENQVLTIDVLANDTDVDDGTHLFTLVAAEAPAGKGSVSVVHNQLAFNPANDFNHLAQGASEQVTLTYMMQDEFGASSTSTVTVTVTGTNDAPVALADSAAGTENQTLVIDVLANDADVDDGHLFTLMAVDAPAGKGNASVANNQLVFAPGSDFDHLAKGVSEQVTLTYSMQDEFGAVSDSTVTVTVTGANDGPVAVVDNAAGEENQTLVIDVLANDTDADDGHSFTLVAAEAPVGKGIASVAGNQLVFVPGNDFDHLAQGTGEQVTLTYTMQDEFGASSSSTVTVIVTGANDAPIAVLDNAVGTENQVLTIDVLANDTDSDDGHLLTLMSAAVPANKGSVGIVNNQVEFTPGTDFDHLAQGASEQVAVSYTVTDEFGAASSSAVTVTITGTNDAPIAFADNAAGTENQALTIDVLANDTDLDDGHTFTLLAAEVPAGKGAVSVMNNQLVFSPGGDFDHLAQGVSEQVTLTYNMQDEFGVVSGSTISVVVNGTNDAPLAVADAATAIENQVLTIDVLVNDTDADDNHSLTLISAAAPVDKGTASVAENRLVFTPGSDFDHLAQGASEQVTLTYGMQDEFGALSSSTVTVTVTGTNDAPIAAADSAAGAENQTLTIDVLANDTDVDDGYVLSLVAADVLPNKGAVSIVEGRLVFNPGSDFEHLAEGVSEQVTLAYSVTDEFGSLSSSTVAVTVTGTNDAPLAVADSATGTENQSLAIDVLANDTDVDDEHLFMLTAAAVPVNKGETSVVDNQLVFTPGSDFDHLAQGVSEQVTLTYEMKDEFGGFSSSTATVTITGANDVPVAVADNAGGTENQALTIDVLGNDTDIDAGHLFTLVSAIAPANKGMASVVDNQLVFVPGADFDHLSEGASEQVTLTYLMKDEFGASAGGNVTVTVNGANDGPVAVADSAAATQNQTITVEVLANDTDLDDGHTFTLLSAEAPADKGVVSVANNQLVFSPGNDFDHLAQGAGEQVTLTYVMKDEFGVLSSSTATVTVVGANDNPAAVADSAAGTESQTLTIDVLANDTDTDDGHQFTLLTTGTPADKGTVSVVDNKLVFNPGSDFEHLAQGTSEQVTLTYSMTDEFGASSTGSVTVSVSGINDTPIAVADNAAATQDQALAIDVLANDTDADDGHVLTLVAANAPTNKSTVSVVNNQLVFSPGSDFSHLSQGASEQVTLTYTMKDEFGAVSDSNVTVTINGANDAPIAEADSADGTEIDVVTIDVLANDTDIDNGHLLTLVSADAPAGKGTVSVVDNQLVFNPGSDFSYLVQGATEQVVLNYTVQDEFGALSSGTVALTLTATLDKTVSLATINTTIGTDSGATAAIESGGSTRDATLQLSGTAEANSTVEIFDGTTKLGNATLVGTEWTYTTSVLSDGTHGLTATITDAVGNVAVTEEAAAIVDTVVGPATINTTIGTETGATTTIASGGSTKDATLTLSGTAEAGSTITVFDGMTSLGKATLVDTAWSFTTQVLSNGTHNLTAKVVDAVGNVGTTLAVTATVDTLAPTLSFSVPADNATMVVTDSNIVLTFSEAVKVGTGNIVLSDGASDTRTIAIIDTSQVTISGDTVTIKPTENLRSNTGYNLEFVSGVIQDLVGNAYAGIGDTGAIKFVTAPVSVVALSSLNGSNGFRLDGIAVNDQSGRSVSTAGDVNGDGFDDLLVGAHGTDPHGSNSGASYVVFGKASGFGGSMDLSSLNGNNGFRLDGVAIYDQSGYSVSTAGDVNGDGFDDLLVGALNADPHGSNSGSSYVVFGKASGFGASMDLSSLNGSNGFRLAGVAANDQSGRSVSAAGDVNGDGFDDFLVGALNADPHGSSSGSSYVVFGKASGFGASMDLSSLNGSNGFRLDGVAIYDQSGFSVSAAGDVNGDGFDDLLVGAFKADPHGSYSGSSYVVFGKTSGFGASMDLSSLNGSNGFRLDGVAALDQSGFSVSAAGDVNGDGFDDLLVGALGADPHGSSSGSSYVVFGKASGFGASMDLSSLNGSNGFRLDGVAIFDLSGFSVSSAGDVNGDGFDDLLVGTFGADPHGSYSGSNYVVFGKASGFGASMDLSSLNGSNGFRVDGVAAGDFLGRSVSSAGDVNGDGFDDLLIGAHGADLRGSNSGSSYVVFGSNFNNAVSFLGSSDADALIGNAAAERFVGGAGTDTLTGGGGADVFYGGAGNDTIVVSDLVFQRVDGGNGDDTLRLSGTGMNLNLANFRNKIEGIETIDITGSGNNALTLTALDLLNLSDSSNTLIVNGNAGDTVSLLGSDWTDGGIVNEYHTYTNGQAVLRVSTAITVPKSFISLSSLNGTNGFKLSGTQFSGYSVNSAGDINGDGFDDVIVGSPFSGASYVVFGKASGLPANISVGGLDGTTGFILDRSSADGFLGCSVSSGDINGDGFSDFIIGAWQSGPHPQTALNSAGAAYVVFGRASSFPAHVALSGLDGSNGFRMDGTASMSFTGFSVSSAGDINGDGFDDVLVGATNSSSSYVVFGKSAGFSAHVDLLGLNGNDGFRIVGSNDLAGRSVHSAGDVNGDGFDDLIIGAPKANPHGSYSGASYVLFGKGSGFAANVYLSNLDGSNGFTLDGVAIEDRSGTSVSAAGDINGDGFGDLIVASPFTGGNASLKLSSYVVFGKASGFTAHVSLSNLDGSNGFRLDGEAKSDFSGQAMTLISGDSPLSRSVSTAGDINGDGYDDLIVGDRFTDVQGNNSGSSYVVYGKASGFSASMNLADLDGNSGFRLSGPVANGGLGISVGAAGDVNGDGFDDLIVGSTMTAGASHVVFGGNFTGAVTFLGGSGAEAFVGAATSERFVSGGGNDTLTGGGGADVFYGGEGNDIVVISDLAFQRIDGGNGNDTLQLSGAGINFSLANFRNKIEGVESIDITGNGNNILNLTSLDLLNLSDSSNTLRVDGNAGDTVNVGAGWVEGGIFNGYHSYTQGQAILLIGIDITVVI